MEKWKTYNIQHTLEDIQSILIGEMAECGVRKEMCLPVLLMIGKAMWSMLVLAVYCRDYSPDEHHVIEAALYLEANPPLISSDPETKSKDFYRAVAQLKKMMDSVE